MRIPNNKPQWLPLLRDLYRFEEPRVSGPGSQKRRFSDVIWDKELATRELNLDESSSIQFDDLLSYLISNRQLMVIPELNGPPERYLTRVAELVRTIGHTYEYWNKGRASVSATRWLVEDKKVPKLVIPSALFVKAIKSKCEELIQGKKGFNLCKAAEEVCIAVAKSINEDWETVKFSEFQLDSTMKILAARYGENSNYDAQILTAGVGSGKTIGFSIAALIEARKTMLDGMTNNAYKSTSIFVYPRTQLAFDQYEELKKFAHHLPCELSVWLEMSKSYKETGGVARGVKEQYSTNATPKGIIITTFETLKRRMRRPEFMLKMSNHLSTVIVDEVHLLSGISGGMSSQLLSRLGQTVYSKNKPIHWIGASATIARPDVHGGKLFGLDPSRVQVVGPSETEMEQAGINHHIFVRPSQGMSLLGTLTNVTSLVMHQRRHDLNHRPQIGDNKRVKSIGFADNLEMLGRWNDDFRENERSQHIPQEGRTHPRKDTPLDKWSEKQREIPYAWRFIKPLQRRLSTVGGNDSDNPGDAFKDLTSIFDKEKASKVCDTCQAGERVTLGMITPEDLDELKKLVYRVHHKDSDKIQAIIVDSDEFKSQKSIQIGSHDLCPYLQAGACTWFPQPDTDAIFEIPGSKEKFVNYGAIARSTVFSSKSTNVDDSEGEKGISAKIFRGTPKEVFDVGGEKHRVPVDIVLASPSLEVGVDLPMLTESVLVKSVRNIASYRQKVGRVGRERNLDTVNVSLMTDSNVDLHYYRQPKKLVSEGRLEPVPLMDKNRAIVASSAYGAVWEWLALFSGLPEHITSKTDGSLGRQLRKCRDSLDTESSSIEKYISDAISNTTQYLDIIQDAIQQVRDELDLFLLNASPTYTITPSQNYEPKVIDMLGMNIFNKSAKSNQLEIRQNQNNRGADVDKVDRLIQSIKDEMNDLDLINFSDTLNGILQYLSEVISSRTTPKLNELEPILTRMEQIKSEFSLDDGLESIHRTLKRVLKELGSAKAVGMDQRIINIYSEYDEFPDKVHGGDWKRVYLSDVMDNLSEIEKRRKDSWFLRPNTLFENPYTKEVTLQVVSMNPNNQPTPLNQSQTTINVNEAIYAFLPGTWNHRIPHRRLKVRTGSLTPSGGWVLATLSQMNDVGNKFRRVHDSELPAPPGSDSKLQIYAPTHLVLIESFGKYVRLNKNTLQVMDKDETDYEHPAVVNTKLPRSFQNRWAWSPSNDEGLPAQPFCLPNHKFEIENVDGNSATEGKFDHPMLTSLIDSVEWFNEKEIIEYTYGVSRSFAGKGEITLGYRDKHDRTIGFGEKYSTQAIGFSIKKEHIAKVIDNITSGIENNDGKISPSMIRCLKAYVLTNINQNGASINHYTLEDLISILLIFSNWTDQVLTPTTLMNYVENGKEQPLEFRKTTEEFVRIKMKLDQKYADEEQEIFESDSMVNSRVDQIYEALQIVHSFISKFHLFVPKWVHRTVLSTFGVVATNSLQQFCGSDDNDVAYLIEEDSWDGEDTRVVVYDKANYGNGSCKTAFEFLHIPHVVRASSHARNAKLPTTDYISTLEENLLQCLQHQVDLGALEIISDPSCSTLSTMPDLVKHAKENYHVGHKTWDSLGIRTINDAWKLPLHKRLAPHHEKMNSELRMDDIIRASTICWNGCPECVDQLRNTLGGMLGANFIDKFIIDEWFLNGTKSSIDYEYLDFEEMANATAKMHFGSLNRLHLITPESDSKRSICLPWTMGFHIKRDAPFSTNLVIRSTDVSNLRIGGTEGGAHGIDRHGFERLLWFNLLMSAHLDAVNALTKEQKKVQLLYYDARDLKLKDLGLSPRMIDSMKAVMENQEIEKLSDVLIWMAKRDFKVDICVDKRQGTQIPIRKFLSRLRIYKKINIRQRVSEDGSMHKKILISPIAALTGSANLTYSGSNLNDETLVHVTSNNTTQYESIKANARTTFNDSEPFDFNYKYKRRGDIKPGNDQTPIDPLNQELELIIKQFEDGTFSGEDLRIECKSCYAVRKDDKWTAKDSTDAVFREVASMMNTEGGHVFVGVENETWNVVGIDKEIKQRKNIDRFLSEVNMHIKHNLTDLFGSYIYCQVKTIIGKSVLVISCKPCKRMKVWFKPRGTDLKKYLLDEDYGCLFIRNGDDVSAIKKINRLLEWSYLRFGLREI